MALKKKNKKNQTLLAFLLPLFYTTFQLYHLCSTWHHHLVASTNLLSSLNSCPKLVTNHGLSLHWTQNSGNTSSTLTIQKATDLSTVSLICHSFFVLSEINCLIPCQLLLMYCLADLGWLLGASFIFWTPFSSKNTSKCQKTRYSDLQKPLIPQISIFSIIMLYQCSWTTEMLLSKFRSRHLHSKSQNHRYDWYISYCKSQLAK